MRTSDENSISSPITPHLSDLDWPFTDEELKEIDDALQSATTSLGCCRHVSPNRRPVRSCRRPVRSCRRLPQLISCPEFFSPAPCLGSQFFSPPTPAITVRYPTLMFRGQISYSRTAHEVDEAAKELIQFVEAKKKEDGQAILGFDIEWKPSFRRGVQPGKAAVLQICGDTNRCYVMHIIHSGIPKSLQCLLEDDSSIKVGVSIANDGKKVFNDYNVSVKALEDLSSLANRKLGGDQKKWSLASLAEKVICKELPKPVKIRLGNWEEDVLSKQKLKYAATDAFASWYLYQALKSHQKITTKKVKVGGKIDVNK